MSTQQIKEKKCRRCKKEKLIEEFLDKQSGRENKACASCLREKREKVKMLKERESSPINVSYWYWKK